MIYIDPNYRVHPTEWTDVGVPFVANNPLTKLSLFTQDVVTDQGDDPMTDEEVSKKLEDLRAAQRESAEEYVNRATQSNKDGGHMVVPADFKNDGGASAQDGEQQTASVRPNDNDGDEIVIDDSPMTF